VDAGTVDTRLLLDTSHFQKQLLESLNRLNATMGQMGQKTKTTTDHMGKSVEKFGHDARRSAALFSKEWWNAFGKVALGFTIAYRAMNAFEQGLRSLLGTFKSGIDTIDDFRVAIAETAAT